jgi:hypothetical protein
MAQLDQHALEGLSRWSIAGRYPADVEEATAADAAACLDAASRVIDCAVVAATQLVGVDPDEGLRRVRGS